MPSFGKVSKQRLDTCDPRLVRVLERAIVVTDFAVLTGHRNKEDQDRAFSTGKSTKEWPDSRHNRLPSVAVDIAPWLDVKPHIDWRTDKALWKADEQGREAVLENIKRWHSLIYFIVGVGYAMGIELESGSDWNGNFQFNDQNFIDLVHLQLKSP